jgi:hypothetical protein
MIRAAKACSFLLVFLVTTEAKSQAIPSVPQQDTTIGLLRSSTQYQLITGMFEPTYITVLSGLGNQANAFFFEGTIAPNLSFAWRRVAIVGTPKIVLRMYDEHSNPVRRPSYMPGAHLYWWGKPAKINSRTGFPFARLTLWNHHSNGQDGEFYNEDTGEINTDDGSFSLNFMELSGGWLSIDRNGRGFGTARLGLRVNLPVNEAEPLRHSSGDKYGAYRFIVGGSGNATREWLAASFGWELQYILDSRFQYNPYFSTNRLTGSFSLVYSLKQLQNAGILVNGFWGQDYYNISYKQRFWAARLGIAFNATTTFLAPR